MDGFGVMSAPSPMVLPSAFAGAEALVCRRDTLFMSDNDYRVLTELSIPFAFGDGDRVVWLYVRTMRFLMHMDDGELTPPERDQIERALARAQTIMAEQHDWPVP